MRSISIFVSILVWISLFCCADNDSQEPEQVPLLDTLWRLDSIELINETISADEEQELTLQLLSEFDGDYNTKVRADCNHCSGIYTFAGEDSISIYVGCTMAYCGEDSHGSWLEYGVNHATTYEQYNTVLYIEFTGEYGSGRLRFQVDES